MCHSVNNREKALIYRDCAHSWSQDPSFYIAKELSSSYELEAKVRSKYVILTNQEACA